MAKYSTFKYGDGTKYGTEAQDANLRWTFIVAWNGYFGWGNEAERMIDLTVERGRQRMLGRNGLEPFLPGRAVGIFDNSDGRYDPFDTTSPIYGHITPGKFVRIAIYDDTLDSNWGILRGIIEDIQPITQGDRQLVRIVVVDGLRWLQDRTINVGLKQSIDYDTIPNYIADACDWPDTEWGTRLTDDNTDQTYWWAWAQNAFKALREWDIAQQSVSYCDRDGKLCWNPRGFTHRRTRNIAEADVLKDIGRPQPWEVVRNMVRVYSSPKVLDAVNTILWQLRDVASIAAGETFYIECLFKYQEWQPCGSGIGFTHTCNTQADGGGADVTGSCPLTYDADIGEGARIWIHNPTAATAYITLLKATGDAIYAPNVDIQQEEDEASKAAYGPQSIDINSRWQESTDVASSLATDWLAAFKDPAIHPIVQFENSSLNQYWVDLYDRLVVNLPTLGILAAYRIGHIHHQWLNENGQAVRTTMRLEPYLVDGEWIMAYRGARVYRITSAQEIPNADATEIAWNGETHDITAFHSLTTNTGRITIPTGYDGYYRVYAQIKWEADAGATGLRIIYIKKNGGATAIHEVVADANPENMVQFSASCHDLDAGDYLTVEAYQSSGGALDVEHGTGNSFFGVDFLGA